MVHVVLYLFRIIPQPVKGFLFHGRRVHDSLLVGQDDVSRFLEGQFLFSTFCRSRVPSRFDDPELAIVDPDSVVSNFWFKPCRQRAGRFDEQEFAITVG